MDNLIPVEEFWERFRPRNLGDIREETGGDGEYGRETTQKEIFTIHHKEIYVRFRPHETTACLCAVFFRKKQL